MAHQVAYEYAAQAANARMTRTNTEYPASLPSADRGVNAGANRVQAACLFLRTGAGFGVIGSALARSASRATRGCGRLLDGCSRM